MTGWRGANGSPINTPCSIPTASSSTPGVSGASCPWASSRTTPPSRTAWSSGPRSSASWPTRRSRSDPALILTAGTDVGVPEIGTSAASVSKDEAERVLAGRDPGQPPAAGDRHKCDLHHIGIGPPGLWSKGRRAIDDGGRSSTTALWAFPPSTWPRGSGSRGLFLSRLRGGPCRGARRIPPTQKKRAGPGPARRSRDSAVAAALIAQARGVRYLFPAGQAFGDDLRRLQGRLAKGGIFDDLTLHARALVLQHVAQGLQLGDQLVDLLHRGARHALQQGGDVVGDHLAVAFRLAPKAGRDVATDEFPDFPFHRCLHRDVEIGGITRIEKGHV